MAAVFLKEVELTVQWGIRTRALTVPHAQGLRSQCSEPRQPGLETFLTS